MWAKKNKQTALCRSVVLKPGRLWICEAVSYTELKSLIKKKKKKEISNNIQDRIFLQNKNF